MSRVICEMPDSVAEPGTENADPVPMPKGCPCIGHPFLSTGLTIRCCHPERGWPIQSRFWLEWGMSSLVRPAARMWPRLARVSAYRRGFWNDYFYYERATPMARPCIDPSFGHC